jgi:hypothetical protein
MQSKTSRHGNLLILRAHEKILEHNVENLAGIFTGRNFDVDSVDQRNQHSLIVALHSSLQVVTFFYTYCCI